MSQVVLPDHVRHNLERELMAERHGAWFWFDRALKDIDPRLSLIKAKPNAMAPGMKPNYWHVKRHNDAPAPDTYITIEGVLGEFIEPSSGWLDRFRADDAWNNGGWDAMEKKWAQRAAARVRDRALKSEERVDEFNTRVKAIDNPGVSMAPGWTYRKAGQRGKSS